MNGNSISFHVTLCVCNPVFTYRSLSAQWLNRGKSSRCCSFQDNQGRAPPPPTPNTDHRTELSKRDSHRKKALETNFLSSLPSPHSADLKLLFLSDSWTALLDVPSVCRREIAVCSKYSSRLHCKDEPLLISKGTEADVTNTRSLKNNTHGNRTKAWVHKIQYLLNICYVLPMQTGFGLFQPGLPSPPMMQVRVASPSSV